MELASVRASRAACSERWPTATSRWGMLRAERRPTRRPPTRGRSGLDPVAPADLRALVGAPV